MTDMKNEIDSDLDQNYSLNSNADPKNMQELTIYVQNLLQNVQDKFQTMSDQIITRIDDMGNRIDDLEKSIADLMNQAGVEGPEKLHMLLRSYMCSFKRSSRSYDRCVTPLHFWSFHCYPVYNKMLKQSLCKIYDICVCILVYKNEFDTSLIMENLADNIDIDIEKQLYNTSSSSDEERD
uniref:Heat shock factor-binding protein 1 n=1 Tax=Glossina brevipalpis TaxID=37001 RepID=A0A1A9WZN5_9MUSC